MYLRVIPLHARLVAMRIRNMLALCWVGGVDAAGGDLGGVLVERESECGRGGRAGGWHLAHDLNCLSLFAEHRIG